MLAYDLWRLDATSLITKEEQKKRKDEKLQCEMYEPRHRIYPVIDCAYHKAVA